MGLRAVYRRFVKNLRNERVTHMVDKRKCIQEQTVFELLFVGCIYCANSVLKNCFCGVKFRAKFEVLLQKLFLSVVACFQNQSNGASLL